MVSMFLAEKKRLHFTIQEGGVDVDVSTATITFTLARRIGESALITKTATFKTDGTDGEIYVDLVSSDTEDLSPGNYWYELEVEFPGSTPYIAQEDYFTLKHRVKAI